MSTPQTALGGISPDRTSQLFEDIGSIKAAQAEIQRTQENHGRQISDIHKAVYGNGEPSLDMRIESLERQMTKRHALSAGIAGAVSMIYNLAMSRLGRHE